MRSEAHLNALRAAARVAFSVAFLGGCSAAGNAVDGDEVAGDETDTSESAIASGSKKPGKGKSVGKKPCPSSVKDAGKPSCDVVLASAFGDAGGWPTGEETISADAKTCCAEVVKASLAQDPTLPRSPYHWQCCAATNWGDDLGIDGGVGFACTPWGPPVPPPMKKRVIKAEPELWMVA